METVIAAIVTGIVAISVCIVNNHYQSKATRVLIEYKLEELTKRVDKHNNVIDRTFVLEKVVEVQAEKIKVANNRIEDLEKNNPWLWRAIATSLIGGVIALLFK